MTDAKTTDEPAPEAGTHYLRKHLKLHVDTPLAQERGLIWDGLTRYPTPANVLAHAWLELSTEVTPTETGAGPKVVDTAWLCVGADGDGTALFGLPRNTVVVFLGIAEVCLFVTSVCAVATGLAAPAKMRFQDVRPLAWEPFDGASPAGDEFLDDCFCDLGSSTPERLRMRVQRIKKGKPDLDVMAMEAPFGRNDASKVGKEFHAWLRERAEMLANLGWGQTT